MKFHSADFGQIEVRVLFWLADHKDGLAAFKLERPIYEEMAAIIFNKPIEEIAFEERQIGKNTILGCGFGMGHKKFKDDVKSKTGVEITELLAKQSVTAYRTLHYPIPVFWKQMERAVWHTLKTKRPTKIGRIRFDMWGTYLTAELPSGRKLYYPNAALKMEASKFVEDERVPVIYHEGLNQKTRKWAVEKTYGGKLVENVVQATARDLMREAMFRVEDNGYRLALTIHDELLATSPGKSQDEFVRLMAVCPDWAAGIPIKVSGWTGPRYRK
jgi:DNA polymerase